MFDEIEPRGFSPGLFVFQLFAIPPLCLISGILVSSAINPGGPGSLPKDLASYVVFAFLGSVYGYVIQARFRRAIESGGRWVWAAPFGLFSLALVEVLTTAKDRGDNIAGLFAPSLVKQSGEYGLGFAFFTLPALACIAYSTALIFAGRRRSAAQIR